MRAASAGGTCRAAKTARAPLVLRYLERIPPHAAVSESVQLVRRARKVSAAGFVNAVLRKVDRRPVAWPDRAVELSHPAWLLERFPDEPFLREWLTRKVGPERFRSAIRDWKPAKAP